MSRIDRDHNVLSIIMYTQLFIPLIPLVFDSGLRIIFLWNLKHYWEIFDLVTLLATFSLFCLYLSDRIKPPNTPSDDVTSSTAILVKDRLILNAIGCICLAVVMSAIRAIDESNESYKIMERKGWIFITITLIVVISSFIRIIRTDKSYIFLEN